MSVHLPASCFLPHAQNRSIDRSIGGTREMEVDASEGRGGRTRRPVKIPEKLRVAAPVATPKKAPSKSPSNLAIPSWVATHRIVLLQKRHSGFGE